MKIQGSDRQRLKIFYARLRTDCSNCPDNVKTKDCNLYKHIGISTVIRNV